jgi:DNA polymerase I
MIIMRGKNFGRIVVCDFEYEVPVGDLPDVLCMVAHVLDEKLQHVQTIKRWRGEFGAAPPFDIGPDTLVVAYSAWAEMTCFKVLDWKFPVHIFDQHAAYLAASNLLLPYDPDEERIKQKKGLEAACVRYGIEGWKGINKKEIAKDIGEGRWHKYGRAGVEAYCEEDVRVETELLRAQLHDRCDYRGHIALPAADVERVLHWSNYSSKSIALIQARGIPWDVPLWNLVQENKIAIIRELLRQFDPSFGEQDSIYDLEGHWSYERFKGWLVRRGILTWPHLESGALDTSGDAFRLMYHEPGIENLHTLRDSVGFINKATLPIGRDGRNRPSLFPFGTATGRNAHAQSPFNAHAGVRGFMLFPPETIGAYIDWRTQEVGVAAERSDDKQLKADYLSGDVYHALARMCGLTDDPDPIHWKKTEPAMRDRMKALQLGINYGMGVPSLARGLNRHPLIASEIIERHKRRCPRYWEWRDDMVHIAMMDRRIESTHGWPLRISNSPNKRTLYNFPMQSGGAEMLRLAAWRLCEAGIVPIMLVHDAILLEESDMEKIEHAKEIMEAAGRDVLGGFKVDSSFDQKLSGGARYSDKRPKAKELWNTMMKALVAIGAIEKKGAA